MWNYHSGLSKCPNNKMQIQDILFLTNNICESFNRNLGQLLNNGIIFKKYINT